MMLSGSLWWKNICWMSCPPNYVTTLKSITSIARSVPSISARVPRFLTRLRRNCRFSRSQSLRRIRPGSRACRRFGYRRLLCPHWRRACSSSRIKTLWSIHASGAYTCLLYFPSGSLAWRLPVSAQLAKDTVPISVPATNWVAGTYTLIVQGNTDRTPADGGVDLEHQHFDLKIQD
jgi:hypothetical protein